MMSIFGLLLSILCLISLAVAFKKDPCGLDPYKGGNDVLCRMNDEENWSYDANNNECYQFTYGGCGGNNNRFKTPEECEDVCKTKDPCAMKAFPSDADGDYINCFMRNKAWSYVAESNKCVAYNYSCGGNDNHFDTREKCESRCQKP